MVKLYGDTIPDLLYIIFKNRLECCKFSYEASLTPLNLISKNEKNEKNEKNCKDFFCFLN